MKTGMNMLLWTDHVSQQHFPIIEALKETGYDGVEVPLGIGNKEHYRRLGSFLDGLDMGCTCVTSLLADTNIASASATVRAAGLDRLKWAIDMAAALGAETICGPIHSAFAHFSQQPPSRVELQRSAEVLRAAGDYAQAAGIILTPEALNRFECYLVNTMEQLKALLIEVDHPSVGAIYDTHHAHIEEKSQFAAIQEIGPYLRHVHITENDRGTPGKGQVNWAEVFSALRAVGYDGWLVIEAFSTAIPDFANSINVWRDYSPTDEIYQEGYRFIQENWNRI